MSDKTKKQRPRQDSEAAPPSGAPRQFLAAFELFLDPGDASSEEIQALFEALNNYDVACGGTGFSFEVVAKDARWSPPQSE